LYNLGSVLYDLRQTDEAIRTLRRSIALYEKLGLGEGAGSGWSVLGLALCEAGRYDEALAAHERARALLNGEREALARSTRSAVHDLLKRHAEALQCVATVLRYSEDSTRHGVRRNPAGLLRTPGRRARHQAVLRQRQRVALVRTILRNAPIQLLDEATSALDSESKLLIQEALRAVARMDKLIVLDRSEIIERDRARTHACGSTQSGGFLTEEADDDSREGRRQASA
jgi:tetratricopeptide (TPR) repeat protein